MEARPPVRANGAGPVPPRPVLIIFGAAVRPGGEPSGAMRDRVSAAVVFGRTLNDPIYLATGGVGHNPPSEARLMHRLLREAGVAANSIILDETADDTLSSVTACARIVAGMATASRNRWPSVYAVSNAYHLPRCVLLLRLAGIKARGAPPPPAAASSRFGKRWWWRAREVAALPYDAALMVMRGRRGGKAV